MARSRLDEALDALFSVPPAEFIAKRDALMKELKTAGDKDAAAQLKSQHKPTLAAHALNQLARTAGPELAGLFEASRQLATGKSFKANLERQRALLEQLRAKMAGPELPELLTVVRGAMVDPALAERVKLGRFSSLPEIQVGFFGSAPEGSSAPPAEESPPSEAPPRPRVDRAALARAKAERERAERLARELEAAESELAELTAAAEDAERKAGEARRRAQEAEDRARRLRARSR